MKIADKNILCIGEVLWDVLPTGRKPGGAPMNVALHLSRLGNSVQIASRVGVDRDGEDLTNFILEQGLGTSQIQLDPELPTSEVFVKLDTKNNAKFEIPGPVAWDNIKYTAALQDLSQSVGLIVYGTLGSRNTTTRESIIKTLKSEALKLIDVNLRSPYTKKSIVIELLLMADIAKLNDDELHIIAGWDGKEAKDETELMEWIVKQYKLKMIVVTKGDKGAILFDKEEDAFHQHNGYTIQVADTVGAGDAFLAGLISSILKGKSPDEALGFACATGAFVASQSGATPNYQYSDISEILKQNNSNS